MPEYSLSQHWWGAVERIDRNIIIHITPDWPVSFTVEWRWDYGMHDLHISAGTSLGFGVSLGLWCASPSRKPGALS